MPQIAGPEFVRLNLMAGTARVLEQVALTPDDLTIFNRDFDLLVEKLSKVDPELGHNLGLEKDFYNGVNQVAKGYFNEKPFGGLKSSTGQYGMVFLSPQHLKSSSPGTTPSFYSWGQTLTVNSGYTYTDVLGSTSAEVYASAETEKKEVLGFHAFLSYKPDPKLILLGMEINDYPYAPWNVEPYAKITKAEKLFKILPMPGRVILHPGGKFSLKGFFDMTSGTGLGTGLTIDVEIAPFGLCFAEYDQLKDSQIS